jgi:hypothetical protein
MVGHRWPPLTAIAIAVTDTATSLVVIPVIAVLCLVGCRGSVWRRLGPVVLLVAGVVSRTWTSDLVARARPPVADWVTARRVSRFPRDTPRMRRSRPVLLFSCWLGAFPVEVG